MLVEGGVSAAIVIYFIERGIRIYRNYDKFTNQDLYSSAIGDDLNEKIIANGLKFISTSNNSITL